MERAIRNLAGPTIRKLRTEKNLSQADLAAKCQTIGWDISRDIVASIEDQSRAVTDSEIVLLAIALKVEAKVLLPTPKAVLSASPRITDASDQKRKRRGWLGL